MVGQVNIAFQPAFLQLLTSFLAEHAPVLESALFNAVLSKYVIHQQLYHSAGCFAYHTGDQDLRRGNRGFSVLHVYTRCYLAARDPCTGPFTETDCYRCLAT